MYAYMKMVVPIPTWVKMDVAYFRVIVADIIFKAYVLLRRNCTIVEIYGYI